MSTLAGKDDVPSSDICQEDATSFDIAVDLRLILHEDTTSDPPTAQTTPRGIELRSDSYCLERSGCKLTEWKITTQRHSSITPRTTGTSPGTNVDRGVYSVTDRQSPQSQFTNRLPCTI